MKYVSNDGKYFDTPEECVEYEKSEEKKKSEKEARIKEIEDAEQKYYELYDKFLDDYGHAPDFKGMPADWQILRMLRVI